MSDDLRDAIAAKASTEWSCCVIEERVPDVYWIADAVLAMPEIVDMLALRRMCGDLTVEQVARALRSASDHLRYIGSWADLTDDERAISQWREPT